MTEVDAGAEIHLGDIHLAIGTLSEEVKQFRKEAREMQDDLDQNGSVIYSTTTGVVNFIDLGHPSAGKKWQVRAIQVGGADITTQPAGVAWVVVQAIQPTNNPSFVNVVDWSKTITLPWNNFYGRGEFIVHQMEHIYILLLGGANGTMYTASADVESFPEWRAMRP